MTARAGVVPLTAPLTDKVAQALQAGAAFVVSGGAAPVHGSRGALGRARIRWPCSMPRAPWWLKARYWLRPCAWWRCTSITACRRQADEWEHFCMALCREAQVPLVTERVAVQALAGEGIEAAARRARYAALGRMCRAAGRRAAAVRPSSRRSGGNRADAAVPGRRGGRAWPACPPRRPLDAQGDVQLLRPWLDVSRDEIDAYCAAHGLSWIEDPSNTDTRFARNALRAQLPALREAFLRCTRTCSRPPRIFGQAAAMLDGLAAGELARLVSPGRDADTLAELDLAGLRASCHPVMPTLCCATGCATSVRNRLPRRGSRRCGRS